MSAPAGFPARLLRLRADAGMTQKELARASGVSVPQIARYETGVSNPRLTAIVKLAKALGVDPDYLRDASEEPEAVEIYIYTQSEKHPIVAVLPKDVYSFMEEQASKRGISTEAMMLLTIKKQMAITLGGKVDEEELLRETLEIIENLPPAEELAGSDEKGLKPIRKRRTTT